MEVTKYGITVKGSGSKADCLLAIETEAIRRGGKWKRGEEENGLGLFDHYLNMHGLLWPEDKQHRWFKLGLKAIVENKLTIMLGCANCVSGDTRILNPLTGEQPTIRELCENGISPTVMTLNGPARAGIPFVKGEADLFLVKLSNGNEFQATAGHRVLTSNGFLHVSQLQIGQSLFSYDPNLRESNLEPVPSTPLSNVPDFQKTTEGFQENCSAYFYPDDEQLLQAVESCQSSSPSQVGVLKCTGSIFERLDDSVNKPQCSHPYLQFVHPSSFHADHHFGQSENLGSLHALSETSLHGNPLYEFSSQFQTDFPPIFPSEKQVPDFDSMNSSFASCFSEISHQASLGHFLWKEQTPEILSQLLSNLDFRENELTFFDLGPDFFENNESLRFKVSQVRVESITKTNKEKFYDLCVPGIHHYFAEGAIHHNSGKTYLMSCHALIDFFVFPRTSLAMISTTDIRSLELRIWGRGVKWLFNRARARFPSLPGHVLESKMCIVPDDIDEDGEMARAINMGIVCVPCVSGGRFIGMGKFQGIKPPNSPGKDDGRLKAYNDELAVMMPSVLDAYANWMANKNFKGVGSANPTDISDPACIASEPVGGWDSFRDTGMTQTWRSRWHNAFCLAYDGRDTPNNDEPKDQLPFLASSTLVNELTQTYGADSWQLYQQGIGKPSRGMVSNRVITMSLCELHEAFSAPVWIGTPRTKILHIDPAFGGGDRCVCTESEFGEDANRKQVFSAGTPEIIPIQLNSALDAEDQIANWVFKRSQASGIPASNIFYDSFGRGTLGFAFAKVFGASCPVPVDSGQTPTERPVRFDLYVEEKGVKRLKTCREHYSKFISEAWFSVRETIESDQFRNMSKPVALEGQQRLYRIVKGNKVEVESKDDMKERIKKSPDLFDCLAVGVEGARQLGFQINRIGKDVSETDENEDWFDSEVKACDDAIKSGLLKRN